MLRLPKARGRATESLVFLLVSLTACPVFPFGLVPRQTYVRPGQHQSQQQETKLFSFDAKRWGGPLATSFLPQSRDVVVVGGGLAGLSLALYLSQLDPGRHITIYDDSATTSAATTSASGATTPNTSGSWAAAGMLAPNAERLPRGPLLDLCRASRNMYTEFVQLVEGLAQQAGPEGQGFLSQSMGGAEHVAPWKVGYQQTGGFLAPAFAGDSVATWAPPMDDEDDASPSMGSRPLWLDATQVHELEPYLHPDVVGGWWFPDDASVNARRLTNSLKAACTRCGVQILPRSVQALDLADSHCHGLWLSNDNSKLDGSVGQYVKAKTVVVANGAWMRRLLPVPVVPHKGQSLALRPPPGRTAGPSAFDVLQRVLFAQDSYLVPQALDGRLIVGATVEAGTYDNRVTAGGVMHVLAYATQLIPALADWTLEETWVGMRPTTPDKGPILGATPMWKNLFLAAGYWRNGVLLAPKTGLLLAQLIAADGDVEQLSKQDQEFLRAFSWDRFTQPVKDEKAAAALAASTMYAAAMHPVHTRQSGYGVAAAVGTELGSYATAREAAAERQRDREALFGGGSQGSLDDALERAAQLGKEQGAAYTLDEEPKGEEMAKTQSFEGSVDAFTVGTAVDDEPETNLHNSSPSVEISEDGDGVNPMEDVYAQIRANFAKRTTQLDEKSDADEIKPDPGFRIFHVDDTSGEKTEVPPFTSPGDFLKSIKGSQTESETTMNEEKVDSSPPAAPTNEEEAHANTFDGYTAIQAANSRGSREEELEAMKAARRQNRLEDTDESAIGVL